MFAILIKIPVFEQYQKARLNFAQSIAELAIKKPNTKCLESAGVIELIRPLLSDDFPTVRQCAAVALARICEHDENIAKQIVDNGILQIVLDNLDKYNVYYKRSALYILRAVAKHNEELAGDILRLNGLDPTVECLEDFDTQVKENAAWTLGYIGKHNEQLANCVVDSGALPLMILAFQEAETSLKLITAGALVDLSQHRPEAIVQCGAIPHLVKALDYQDAKLKRSVLAVLSSIASAKPELAELVIAGGALSPTLLHCSHDSPPVRRNAACLLRDIAKHSIEFSQLIVNSGGCAPLVRLINDTMSGATVPAAMALGFIAGQSDQLAMAAITSKGVLALVEVIQLPESNEAELCAAVWAIGHLAKHSPQHSQSVAVSNAFPSLLQIYTNPGTSPELRRRTCNALKQSLQCCLHRPALEPLLHAAPPQILKFVLAQYAKILPNDARARRLFVTTGALKRIQEIDTVPGTSLKEYINIINSCFPEEIVRFYSPGYSDILLDKVEAFTPKVPEALSERVPSECQSEIVHE